MKNISWILLAVVLLTLGLLIAYFEANGPDMSAPSEITKTFTQEPTPMVQVEVATPLVPSPTPTPIPAPIPVKRISTPTPRPVVNESMNNIPVHIVKRRKAKKKMRRLPAQPLVNQGTGLGAVPPPAPGQ